MNRIRTLILSGAVLSMAATGAVLAQSAPSDDKPAAAAGDTAAPEKAMTDDSAMDKAGDRAEGRRGHRRGGWIARLDEDKDGALQPDEMPRAERMKQADTDGDGTLSQKEIEDMVLRQMVQRRAEGIAKRLDFDGDGKVTLSEIQDRQDKRFALLDRNNDGKVDRAEFRQARGGMGMGMGHGRMGGHHQGRKGGDRDGGFRHHGHHWGGNFQGHGWSGNFHGPRG